MKFANEVSVISELEIHRKNVDLIQKEFLKLLNVKYKSCANKVRNIVITDNLKSTMERYNYNNLNEKATATTSRIGELNDIIVNYNNCISYIEGNYLLRSEVKCCLCHELQHVRDRIKYDEFIVNYCEEQNISYNQKIIGEMIFREFNAQFQGQSYSPILWEFNKYSLESNVQKYHVMFINIDEEIKKLNNLEMVQEKLEEIATEVLNFTRNLMYDMSISFGSNAADNRTEQGKKFINIVIEGINDGIDEILNNFIKGFNERISNNKELIIYSLENSLVVYNFINDIFKKIIKEISLS